MSLVPYGVRYAEAFAFGIGLQAIEASVGVGVGLVFLAREGLSFAMLRTWRPRPHRRRGCEEEFDAGGVSARASGLG